MSKKQGKVIKDYDTPYPEPFIIEKGEMLTTSDKDSEWEGWIWCTKAGGKSAWVPESYLEITGESGRVLEAYNAKELSVRTGDLLELIKEVAGWFWCRDKDGLYGWVPGEYIEVTD